MLGKILYVIDSIPITAIKKIMLTILKFMVSLWPTRIRNLKNRYKAIKSEKQEVKKILSLCKFNKKVYLVYDSLVSPPTYGDFLTIVFLARFFNLKGINVEIFLIFDGYRADWGSLDDENKFFIHEKMIKIIKFFLSENLTKIRVENFKNFINIINEKDELRYIFFEEKVRMRQHILPHYLGVTNYLLKSEKDIFIDKFLLSIDEFGKKLEVKNLPDKYICFHIRYNKKWSLERNINEKEFLEVFSLLRKYHRDKEIIIVSDKEGCDYAKSVCEKHKLHCLFSKDFSDSFCGDIIIVLNASFYFQLRGGGIGMIAIYSKIPYELILPIGTTFTWYCKINWSTRNQVIRNLLFGLPRVPNYIILISTFNIYLTHSTLAS